jgi:hypothetical protein
METLYKEWEEKMYFWKGVVKCFGGTEERRGSAGDGFDFSHHAQLPHPLTQFPNIRECYLPVTVKIAQGRMPMTTKME